MSEIKLDNSIREQILAETNSELEQAFGAISDTWNFMTGEDMPEGMAEFAVERCEGRTPDQLWRLKFRQQVLDHVDLPKEVKAIRSASLCVDVSTVQLDAAIRNGLAEEDVVVTELVTMLGERILVDAYRYLGEDADLVVEETVKKINQATTTIDKVNALFEVIGKRHNDVKENDAPAEQLLKTSGGKQLNHIAKLSPITIGQYPTPTFTPSCLAFSIISASFFKKCGVEKLIHTGVVSTVDRPYATTAFNIAKDIDARFKTHLQPYCDNFEQIVAEIGDSAAHTIFDHDPHSSVLFRMDDRWVLFDPFMKSVVLMSEKESERLDKAHEILNEHPALEYIYHPSNKMTHLVNSDLTQFAYEIVTENTPNIEQWRRALDVAVAFQSIEPVRAMLEKLTGGRMPFAELLVGTGLFDTISAAKYKDIDDDEAFIVASRAGVDDFIMSCIARYVFEMKDTPTPEFTKYLERCERDDRYRERIVENLNILPYKIILSALQDTRDLYQHPEELPHAAPHSSLEIRNLAHGVGAACLLDVSYGLNEELSLSFWARQSSSQLPLLYEYQSGRIQRSEGVSRQVANILRNFVEVDNSLYSQLNGIISSP